MVEEEGAAVGEADVLVREVFACGGVGWKGEDLVVVLGVGAFWHGYHQWEKSTRRWDLDLVECRVVNCFVSTLACSLARLATNNRSWFSSL